MILYYLDLLGVAVFAASGALAAGRKSLNWLGVIVMAVVTAIGGGTLRDLLLGRHPIFWIQDPTYLGVILMAAAVTLFYTRYRQPPLRILLIADALGLALFSICGAQIAEEANVPHVIAILMGAMTGVAGGVVRDVLLAEIPLILRKSNIYATAAAAGVGMYLLLQEVGLSRSIASLIGMGAVATLRIAAIEMGIMLPIYRLTDEGKQPVSRRKIWRSPIQTISMQKFKYPSTPATQHSFTEKQRVSVD